MPFAPASEILRPFSFVKAAVPLEVRVSSDHEVREFAVIVEASVVVPVYV